MILLFAALGLLAFFFTHGLFLAQVPGLHFDEAWAASFSHQIATLRVFPLEAMSPYTVPWSHGVTALFFQVFGTHLWVNRLSGVTLAAIGVILMSFGLVHLKKPKAAAFLPWISAFFLPLVLNHRFGIEVTTFHVFCFGLLFWGLVTRRFFAIGCALFLGITSHILFLSIALATWLARRLDPRPLSSPERVLVISVCGVLLPFLFRVLVKIPEHDKAIALLVINFGIALDAAIPQLGDRILSWIRKPLLIFALLLSLPGLFFTLFFSEGHWNILFNYGHIAHPELIGLSWGILILATAYGVWSFYKKQGRFFYPKSAWVWAAFCILMTSLVSTKPTSRYYECGFLFLAVLAATAVSELPKRFQITFITLFILSSSLQLSANYFQPGLNQAAQDRSFSFWIFHDSSSDFLPKQDLVQLLAKNGCGVSDVQTDDPRLLESLRFLSLGDWETQDSCRWGKVSVARKSQRATPLNGYHRVAEIEDLVVDIPYELRKK